MLLIAAVMAAVGVSGWYGNDWLQQRADEQLKTDCRHASLQKDWKKLQRLARKWTESDPASPDAWLNLAEAEVELGRHEEGAAALGHVATNDSRAAGALLQKAAIEWNELNRPLDGLATCEQVLNLNESSIEAHARVIAFYAMTFKRPEMVNAIRRAVRSRGEPREAYIYLMLADQPIFTNAIDLNSRWLASAPDHTDFRVGLAIQTALHRFLTATAEANTDAYANEQEALKRLDEFTRDYEGNSALLSVLLDYYVEEGDEAKVASLLSQVARTSVDDHIIWTSRGWYLGVKNDLEGAQQSLRNALKLHPTSVRALHELATILRRKGEFEEATRLQALSARGVNLRKRLLQLTNARDADGGDLLAIMDLCRDCGDVEIADALQTRLEEMPGLSLDRLRESEAAEADEQPEESKS